MKGNIEASTSRGNAKESGAKADRSILGKVSAAKASAASGKIKTKPNNLDQVIASSVNDEGFSFNADFQSEVSKASLLRISKLTGMEKKQVLFLEFKLKLLEGEMLEGIEARAQQMLRGKNDESMIKGDDAEVAEKQRTNNATLQEMDMLKHRLKLVRHSIRKLNEGFYGLCEETEEPIGFERLCVVPWARFGVHVQEKRERALRDFRGIRLV